MSEHALEARDVNVRFGGVVALDDVAVQVNRGEIVGVIGPNGAGKTTFLNVLSGAQRPTAGSVHIYGTDVSRQGSVRRARSGLARTFQRAALFPELSTLDHLLVGYAAGLRQRGERFVAWRGRDAVQRLAEADESPISPFRLAERLGMEEVLHTPASLLSLGSARLVDLGRAVCAAPRVLLLDEPVSGLSPGESLGVADLLRELAHDTDMGVLVVEHDLDFAQKASDRMVALDFGKVIATGTPAEVLRSKEVRAAYLGSAEPPAGSAAAEEAKEVATTEEVQATR